MTQLHKGSETLTLVKELSTIAMPMRWADLDMLGHVNNVVYLDYAAEARARLARLGELDAVGPARTDIEFKLPMLLSADDVAVHTAVLDDGTLRQEIRLGDADDVYAVVVTGPDAGQADPIKDGVELSIPMRDSDLSPDGSLCATELLEYIQEIRVRTLDAIGTPRAGRYVVAQCTIRVFTEVTWLPEVIARTAVSRVGTSSCTILTDMVDPDGQLLVSSSSVMVGFNADTQRSRPFSDGERDSFASILVEN